MSRFPNDSSRLLPPPPPPPALTRAALPAPAPRADIGKLSKQSIFSLHRGNDGEAAHRLAKAAEGAKKLEPIIAGEPDLRHGSYSAAMEEVRQATAISSPCHSDMMMQKGLELIIAGEPDL